jgi:hypothetical protein
LPGTLIFEAVEGLVSGFFGSIVKRLTLLVEEHAVKLLLEFIQPRIGAEDAGTIFESV